MNCSKRTYPDLRCGGGIETRAVFADADPSIPARGEHRQYMRGDLEVNGQPARFLTVENGVATPRQMRSRPARAPPATIIEYGRAASDPANRFHADLVTGSATSPSESATSADRRARRRNSPVTRERTVEPQQKEHRS
ncbi:hypothetical protein [Streptomyces griseoloalbus]|uniref:hypothetical protein n=1 Tax=Streptomyces griseoloalbus TaxID=67303 RepID=UPI001873DCD4